MTISTRSAPGTQAARRRFLQGMMAAGLAATPAIAQGPAPTHQAPRPMHGVLGAAGAGPGRPKVVWKKREPVTTEVGLPVMPSTVFFV